MPNIKTTLEQIRESYDWEEVFNFVGHPSNPITRQVSEVAYTRNDIEEVIASREGYNDGDSWLGVFKMKDGKYLFAWGWCDYTGWGCRDGGGGEVTDTLEELVACIPDEHRKDLGLV